MRISKIHKIAVSAVVTTLVTAAVLTFTRGESASADRAASLPETRDDAPAVAGRTPGATTKPPPTPSATPSPTTDPATRAPTSAATGSVKPSPGATTHSAPTTAPAPSPSPTPTEKNLLEILLGQ